MMCVCHYMCIEVGSSPYKRISLLGIAHLVMGPPFRYMKCIERQRSNEVVIMKEADVLP